MELKFPMLTAEDIEVKVKKVSEKGAIALLYKTARVDMNILDQVVGPLNWRCSYHDVKGNLYCEISVFDTEKKEWVSKEDCGIESREDDEGNQRKGEASDAFKRAGFKWGIGRELYTAPFTFIRCETRQKRDGHGYELANPFERFSVKSISYDDSGKINGLVICDDKGKEVFNMKKPVKSPDPQKIDGKKAAEIYELLKQTKSDVPAFLKYYHIDKVENIPDNMFERIAGVLKKKLQKAGVTDAGNVS